MKALIKLSLVLALAAVAAPSFAHADDGDSGGAVMTPADQAAQATVDNDNGNLIMWLAEQTAAAIGGIDNDVKNLADAAAAFYQRSNEGAAIAGISGGPTKGLDDLDILTMLAY